MHSPGRIQGKRHSLGKLLPPPNRGIFSSLIPSSLIMIIIVIILLPSTSLWTSFALFLFLARHGRKGIDAGWWAETQTGRQRGRGLWLCSQALLLCLSLSTCRRWGPPTCFERDFGGWSVALHYCAVINPRPGSVLGSGIATKLKKIQALPSVSG